MAKPPKSPAVMICCKWHDVTIPNSKSVICSGCRAECGVSPASLKAASKFSIEFMCTDCAEKEIGDDPQTFINPTPDQMKELMEAIQKHRSQNETPH